MLNFLQLNGGTILLTAVLVLAVVSIIRYLVRQKRQGCSSCGCGCERLTFFSISIDEISPFY